MLTTQPSGKLALLGMYPSNVVPIRTASRTISSGPIVEHGYGSSEIYSSVLTVSERE